MPGARCQFHLKIAVDTSLNNRHALPFSDWLAPISIFQVKPIDNSSDTTNDKSEWTCDKDPN